MKYKYRKITFVSITNDFIRKMVNYWKADKFTVMDTVFPNPHFYLKT